MANVRRCSALACRPSASPHMTPCRRRACPSASLTSTLKRRFRSRASGTSTCRARRVRVSGEHRQTNTRRCAPPPARLTPFRVLNVLQKWLASNLDDFLDNPELLTIFREFLSRRTSADMPFRRQLLQRAFTNEVRQPSACFPSGPRVGRNLTLPALRSSRVEAAPRSTGCKTARWCSAARGPRPSCPSSAARWASWK